MTLYKIYNQINLEPILRPLDIFKRTTKEKVLGFKELLNIILDRCKNEKDILVENGKEILEHLNRTKLNYSGN